MNKEIIMNVYLSSFCRIIVTVFFCFSAQAAPVNPSTLVDLSAESSRPAANDLIRATTLAEATGATPGEPAKRIGAVIAEALKTAKAYSSVKTQSGSTSTFPIYAKGGKIESWRMRSELSLESNDAAALSELLGKLQSSMGVSSLVQIPSPDTRKKAENEAMLDAIAAFKARARIVADALGKPYRIKQLAINSSGRFASPMSMHRASSAMLSESAPMPMEAGESMVTVNISGQIELD
jgi:predicted secreted protein